MSSTRIPAFRFHKGLGYRVRGGALKDQQYSTYDLCEAAIRNGRWDDAIDLAEYTIHEATEPQELYRDWIPLVRAYILRHGIDEETVSREEATLLDGFSSPNGTAFDAEAGWRKTSFLVEEAVAACSREDAARALKALEGSRLSWLETHDRHCDWLQGMIEIAARHLGQSSVGEIWRELMQPMFATYDKYDVDKNPWSESADKLLYVTAEALRGHLSGPERRGSIEYVEEPGRKGFRFTPCGSGGRNFDGTALGNFSRTTEEHDWAWSTKGVCLYCAHCCALSELNPIESFGYPARVVEPPYQNEEGQRNYCTWWIFDDPRDIPDELYRRTGHSKPAAIGSKATRRLKGTGQ